MDDDDKGEETPLLHRTPVDDKVADKIREWGLPEDLTKMILLRVPANDVIRYKLVCKLWLSVISSPEFISDHIKRSNSDPLRNHLLLFHVDPLYSEDSRPRSFGSIVYFLAPCVAVVGSVNGLICVVGKSCHPTLSHDDIWILNPVTGHIMKLPPPSESPCDRGTVSDYDGTGTGNGNGYFVFWWDSVTGDGEYKLAKIVPQRGCMVDTTAASVWVSSSPETWSEIPVDFDSSLFHPTEFASGCDIVVGDLAYWIVFKSTSCSGVRDLFVLSLNLKTISLSLFEIPFPLHYDLHCTPVSIYEKLVFKRSFVLFAANWKGEFALVERVDQLKMYHVWAMDVVEGWSKKCSFDFPILKWMNDVNGKAVVMTTVDPFECGIALYDIGTGEAEVIEDFILGHLMDSAYDFVGSFVSIKGFKPLEAADDFRVFWPYPSPSRCVEGEEQMNYEKRGGVKISSACGSK